MPHRRKVLAQVERARLQRSVDGVGRRHLQQRVAVGRSRSDRLRRDHATGSGTRLDHDRLAQKLAHLRAEHARDDVGTGTDHDADRTIGVVLRV